MMMVQYSRNGRKPPFVILKFRMSCLILDLLWWHREDPFSAFLNILEQAPAGSSANQLSQCDIVLDRLKKITRLKYDVSESDLEKRIEQLLYAVTKGGKDLNALRTLLAFRVIKHNHSILEFLGEKIRDIEMQEPKPSYRYHMAFHNCQNCRPFLENLRYFDPFITPGCHLMRFNF